MSVVLMTHNAWKVAEYRRFLGRHAQTLHVEPPTESKEQLLGWLDEARAVLADESNIFDPSGDLVRPGYVGPARNICRLHAWVKNESGELVRRSFIREVQGTFDASALRPDDPTVFNWDSAFTLHYPTASPQGALLASGATLHAMSEAGLKNSAREQCLSAFVKERLLLEQPKALKWTLLADWNTNARLLLEHPLYAQLPSPLQSALDFVVHEGVFFRSVQSRREGNYWFPGLNGGLPFVAKNDAVHEATYMFHDVMHHLMPDLLFDGVDSEDHRRTYIAYRMMSEAISLVMADMTYVASLAGSPLAPKDYDWAKRRIFPLYQSLPRELSGDLKSLAREVTRFVLRGVPGALSEQADAWKSFEEKYTRFFVADFQWTRVNWKNLHGRAQMVREWVKLVGAPTFRAQGLWFVSDVVARLGRGLSVPDLVEATFELVWNERIQPALTFKNARGTLEERVEHSTERGFRRWLTGQLAFFARYQPLLGLPPLATELSERLREARAIDARERDAIRERFEAHVKSLASKGIISDDDALMFPDCFPLFDPFFLRDYDTAKQEFTTVAEASARAFA
ncbi:MAG: hypothetical protein JNM17_25395 [Archangium sp.]|nr:hypothetical protein [Archangium sp.]